MTKELFQKILFCIVLLLAQVLVLNRVHLFDRATPMIYVYIILLFRRNYPRWRILVWSFSIGLCIDVFSNTPGLAAASLTLLGLLQPYILQIFMQRDSPDDLQPSMATMNVANFTYYTIISVSIYCIVFLTLETFNFFNWMQWIESIGGSILITVATILVIENLRKS